MARLSLRLLGPFSLEAAEGALRPGRKAEAMLACAALGGAKGVARARLATLLWGDLGEEEARNAMRQCLHLLRRSLGAHADALDAAGDRLLLRAGDWEVDATQFEALAARDDTASLLRAAACYAGDFVEGLETGTDFDHWAQAERERLRELAQALLARLSESAADAADCEPAVLLARRLLAADPLHEGCYRSLMRLYARAGLRAKALQVWSECCEVLRRELDVAPSAQTAGLAEQLRQDAASAPNPPRPPYLAPARSGDDPIVVDLLLRGWQLFTLFTGKDNARARAAFEAAIEYAPDHADAIAKLAWTHWMDAVSGWSSDAALSFEYAANCAAHALACRWGVPSAHTVQGKVFLWRMKFDEALDQMHRALALSPSSPYAHFQLGDAACWCGSCEDSLASIDRAMQLEPNDHGAFLTIRGLALWMLREYRQARQALDSAITRNPTYAWPYGILAAVHAECGELDAARHAAAMARRLNRRMSLDFAQQGLPFRVPETRRRKVEAWRAAGMPQHEAPGGLPMGPPHRMALAFDGQLRAVTRISGG